MVRYSVILSLLPIARFETGPPQKGRPMAFRDFFAFSKKIDSRQSRQPRATKLEVESLESRVVPYAASGNLWPQPKLLTLSFVPDGTNLGGPASNLNADFNTTFGS